MVCRLSTGGVFLFCVELGKEFLIRLVLPFAAPGRPETLSYDRSGLGETNQGWETRSGRTAFAISRLMVASARLWAAASES